MSHPDTVALTADHGLGTVRTMPQFRTHIEQGPLSDAQRRRVAAASADDMVRMARSVSATPVTAPRKPAHVASVPAPQPADASPEPESENLPKEPSQ